MGLDVGPSENTERGKVDVGVAVGGNVAVMGDGRPVRLDVGVIDNKGGAGGDVEVEVGNGTGTGDGRPVGLGVGGGIGMDVGVVVGEKLIGTGDGRPVGLKVGSTDEKGGVEVDEGENVVGAGDGKIVKPGVGTPTGANGVDVGLSVVESDPVIEEKRNLEKDASSPADAPEDDRKSDEASANILLAETVFVVVVGIIVKAIIEPSAGARDGGVPCWGVGVVVSTMGLGAMEGRTVGDCIGP